VVCSPFFQSDGQFGFEETVESAGSCVLTEGLELQTVADSPKFSHTRLQTHVSAFLLHVSAPGMISAPSRGKARLAFACNRLS
jgi:hypothetical protein